MCTTMKPAKASHGANMIDGGATIKQRLATVAGSKSSMTISTGMCQAIMSRMMSIGLCQAIMSSMTISIGMCQAMMSSKTIIIGMCQARIQNGLRKRSTQDGAWLGRRRAAVA